MGLKKERCIHCLKYCKEITYDHILPASYYLDNVTGEWKAPACRICNEELGKIENNILKRIVLCLDPWPVTGSPTLDISQRVLRSFNPKAGKNERDSLMREAGLVKVLKETFRSNGATEGFFPNFGYHSGRKPKDQHYINAPTTTELNRFGNKMIRGIEYKISSRFIDSRFDLRITFYPIQDMLNIIRQNGKEYVFDRGSKFYRSVFLEKYFLYEIHILNQLIIYAVLMKKPWWRLMQYI